MTIHAFTLHLMIVLAAMSVCTRSVASEKDNKKDKKVDPEEQLRLDASKLMSVGLQQPKAGGQANDTGYTVATGKFILLEEANDKPLPKVIGYLAQNDSLVPVMILKPSLLVIFKERNKQAVKLAGKYLVRTEGSIFIAEDIILGGGGEVAPMRRKRGGL